MPFIAGKLNFHVFDSPLSAEAKYWLGFLLADGCVGYVSSSSYKKVYPTLKLGLAAVDEAHVAKFANFIGTSAKIYNYWVKKSVHPCLVASIAFWLQGLEVRLAEFGIVPRKTWIDSPVHKELKQDRDFWRGLIDGDGCVCIAKKGGYASISFCGNKKVVEDFITLCGEKTGRFPKISLNCNTWYAALGAAKAASLLDWLYYPGCVSLERKLNIVEKIRSSGKTFALITV